MSQLIEQLYPLPDLRRTPLSTVKWWESRRLYYNRVVGTAGLVTLAGVSILAALPPFSSLMPWQPLVIAPIVYGTAANVCYSLGWVAELVARAVWGRRAPDMGPLLFRQGLIFSVGLTLLPMLVMAMVYAARVVAFLIGVT